MSIVAAAAAGAASAKGVASAEGPAFYVDADHVSASDSNAGSEALPWATIAFGISQMTAGDTLYVKKRSVAFSPSETSRETSSTVNAASYYLPFVVNVSGTAGNPITISAYPGHEMQVGIFGNGDAGTYPGSALGNDIITLLSVNHVIIEGFYCYNAGRSSIRVMGKSLASGGPCTGIVVRGCKCAWSDSMAIQATGGADFNTNTLNQMWLTDVTIEGCEITKTNTPTGVNESISLGNGVQDYIIQNNHIYATDQYGIDCKIGTINGIIRGNLIHDIEKNGIYIDSECDTLEIYNNRVYSCGSFSIVLAREETGDMRHIKIYQNVVHDGERGGILFNKHVDDSGTSAWGAFDDIQVVNNTVFRCAEEGIILPTSWGNVPTNVTIANNLSHGNAGTNISIDTENSPIVANNVTTDPTFANTSATPSAVDLHIPVSSSADGAGDAQYLESATDFDGEAWASPPAAGAYEAA